MSDYIPLDVQMDVVNRLPVKTILRLRRVSKVWKTNIDSQAFITGYGARSSDDCFFTMTFDQGYKGFMCAVDSNLTITPIDPQLQLAYMMHVGNSCGVSCFIYGANLMAVILNPCLRKSIGVFIPFYTNQIECSKISFGFGVRSDTLDPCIVKVSYPIFQTGFWYVSVFSLNNLAWHRLDVFKVPRQGLRLKRKSQAVVGRFIYWATTERLVTEKGTPYKDRTLVSFDMIDNQFHVIEIPYLLKVVIPVPFYVCALGNSVVISGMTMASEIPLFSAWLLDLDGSSITRFSNLFCIPTPVVNRLVGFTSNQELIVEANVGHMLGHTLFVFDQRAEKFVSLGIEGNPGSFYIAPHKESLILINHRDRSLYSMYTS